MIPDPNNRNALLIVDVQEAFRLMDAEGAIPSNPDALENIRRILDSYRQAGQQTIHVRHFSRNPESKFRPDKPGYRVMPEAQELPSEPVIVKRENSAFIGTGLEAFLREHELTSLTIVGATINHCVETTARMAANLGFRVTLVSDATWTYGLTEPDGTVFPAKLVHAVSLANLRGEFADIRLTQDILMILKAFRPDLNV
ncbi:cysteine hydrolase [Acetobacter senegalensis]|uniref:cysteine hydrolase family protein n=1 Tax=Acetobacter senegalensis TaxID=446692 RepID=UPI001EDB9414|nr:cysteine hydrolase family protein [Acetobacter senegalensis]MCG4261915.1 cysteine hydrolase [Acetobacter senegalensis]